MGDFRFDFTSINTASSSAPQIPTLVRVVGIGCRDCSCIFCIDKQTLYSSLSNRLDLIHEDGNENYLIHEDENENNLIHEDENEN